MKKKLLALILACAMVLSLAACGGSKDTPATDDTQEPNQTETQEPSGDTYVVGICQLAPHPALDAATDGFKAALSEAFGEAVTFREGNAGGEAPNCTTIVDGFVAEGVDLILANATSPLQAAAAATSTIPVLGTSVTDYATALGISDWTGTVGGNISGTSDLAPLDQQADMLQELFPDAKNVGLLYCSGEPNSIYQVNVVQGCLEEKGYTCTQYAFTDVNDLPSVTQLACDNSDVIYVPTDNTAANNTGIIDNICRGVIPVFAGEEGICGGCGVATLSISYYDIGYKTGEMAADILANGADVSTMAIEYAPQFVKKYNPATCEALGLTAPEGYEAIVTE